MKVSWRGEAKDIQRVTNEEKKNVDVLTAPYHHNHHLPIIKESVSCLGGEIASF